MNPLPFLCHCAPQAIDSATEPPGASGKGWHWQRWEAKPLLTQLEQQEILAAEWDILGLGRVGSWQSTWSAIDDQQTSGLAVTNG